MTTAAQGMQFLNFLRSQDASRAASDRDSRDFAFRQVQEGRAQKRFQFDIAKDQLDRENAAVDANLERMDTITGKATGAAYDHAIAQTQSYVNSLPDYQKRRKASWLGTSAISEKQQQTRAWHKANPPERPPWIKKELDENGKEVVDDDVSSIAIADYSLRAWDKNKDLEAIQTGIARNASEVPFIQVTPNTWASWASKSDKRPIIHTNQSLEWNSIEKSLGLDKGHIAKNEGYIVDKSTITIAGYPVQVTKSTDMTPLNRGEYADSLGRSYSEKFNMTAEGRKQLTAESKQAFDFMLAYRNNTTGEFDTNNSAHQFVRAINRMRSSGSTNQQIERELVRDAVPNHVGVIMNEGEFSWRFSKPTSWFRRDSYVKRGDEFLTFIPGEMYQIIEGEWVIWDKVNDTIRDRRGNLLGTHDEALNLISKKLITAGESSAAAGDTKQITTKPDEKPSGPYTGLFSAKGVSDAMAILGLAPGDFEKANELLNVLNPASGANLTKMRDQLNTLLFGENWKDFYKGKK